MIGNIAPVNTVHNVDFDQHHQAGAPSAGIGRKGDRYYDSVGRRWYQKTNSTTWIMLT